MANAGWGKIPKELKHKPVISATQFAILNKSPRHLYMQPEFKPTPAMNFGTAFHMALLEPEKFKKTNPPMPEFNRRTNQGKADYAAWMEAHPDHLGLGPKDYEKLESMLQACREIKLVEGLLTDCVKEKRWWWDKGDVVYVGGPDAVNVERKWVVDVKTTTDASPSTWSREIENRKYNIQAALYLDAMTAIYGEEFKYFIWIVVESVTPFSVMTYLADEASLDMARELIPRLTDTFLKCTKTNHWPSYQEGLVPASIPWWAEKNYVFD